MTDDHDDAPPPPELNVEQAFAGAYQELRRLARSRQRGGGRNNVLDTTALVHETLLKLTRNADVSFRDRPCSLGYAGRAMRSIIVDMVRQRQTERAGGEDAMLASTCQEAAGHHRRLPLLSTGPAPAMVRAEAAAFVPRLHDRVATAIACQRRNSPKTGSGSTPVRKKVSRR